MHRFYCPDIASTLVLDDDESRHAVRVLRLAEGDEIEVVDGRGTLYICRIVMAHQHRCAVTIVDTVPQPPHWGHRITLAVAPTKHLDRMEWMVEKCTEMGVDRIIPLRCHNSERTTLKSERLERIAVAAMKQSLKASLPVIDELMPLEQVLAMPNIGQRFIAYCDPALPRDRRKCLAQSYTARTDVMVLIGPEGDFSPEEVDAAMAAGLVPITLGDSRLRTETAALMAVANIHTIDQMGDR